MPPTLPEPVPLDQMILLSTGSGVANPLSPPPTGCQTLREIVPAARPPRRHRLEAVARAAIGAAILFVAIDEIGHLIVDGDVVNLGDGELHMSPRVAVIDRDAYSGVVGD